MSDKNGKYMCVMYLHFVIGKFILQLENKLYFKQNLFRVEIGKEMYNTIVIIYR